MRISDWSSDVCSSDLHAHPLAYLPACRFDGLDRLFDGLRGSGRPIAILSDYPGEAKLRALGLTADLHVSAVDPDVRSEERRVGKECVSTSRSRWSPYN